MSKGREPKETLDDRWDTPPKTPLSMIVISALSLALNVKTPGMPKKAWLRRDFRFGSASNEMLEAGSEAKGKLPGPDRYALFLKAELPIVSNLTVLPAFMVITPGNPKKAESPTDFRFGSAPKEMVEAVLDVW